MAALHEWDPRRGRSGRPWRRLVKKYCPPGSYCQMPRCLVEERGGTREIVFGLRPSHRLGPSLDHIVQLQDGGHPTDPANLRPAHHGCNSSAWKSAAATAPRPRSRAWPI